MMKVFVVVSLLCSALAAQQPKLPQHVAEKDAGRNYGVVGGLLEKIFGVDIPNSYKVLTTSAIGDASSQYPVTAIISATATGLPNYQPTPGSAFGSIGQGSGAVGSTYGQSGYGSSQYGSSGYGSNAYGSSGLSYGSGYSSIKPAGSRSIHRRRGSRSAYGQPTSSYNPYNPNPNPYPNPYQPVDYSKISYYEFTVTYYSDNNGGWFGSKNGPTFTCTVTFIGYTDFLGNTAVDSKYAVPNCQYNSYGASNQ